MCGRTYVILYFDPRVFLCSLRVCPRPKLHQTESGLVIITRITLVEFFCGCSENSKSYGSSISIRVGGSGKLILLSVISPTKQYLLENPLSTRLTTKVSLA